MSNQKNENPGDGETSGKSGGATPMSVSLHTYRFTYVPAGCEDWAVGDIVEVYISDPPPATITLNNGDACDGAIASLVS